MTKQPSKKSLAASNSIGNEMAILLVLSLVTCCIEVDISVPSLPDISQHFNISDGLTQMTIAVNFFGYCLSSVFYGPLSDAYGRRQVMIIGNFIMMLGAIGCAISTTIEMLLFARFIQGIGASTSAVVVFAIVSDVYVGYKAIRLIGMINALLTILMAFAPIAGGFINELIGWQGNYSIVALISFVSWLFLYFRLQETKTTFDKTTKINMVIKNYTALFYNPSFFYSALVPSFCYSGYMIFIACGPFLYMNTYGLPIITYCLHQGAIILIFALTSILISPIAEFFGKRKTVILGISILSLGGLFMMILGLKYANAPYLTTLSMMIISIGAAISYPIIFTKSLEIFPNIKGTSSSAVMSVRFFICSIFLMITSYFYNGHLLSVAYIITSTVCLTLIFAIKLLSLISFEENEEKI